MEIQDYLQAYTQRVKRLEKHFFAVEEKKAVLVSPLAAEMIRRYGKFMKGKGFRGCLTQLGYECFGGRKKEAILKVSLVVEINHAFLLIHDDIMDQSLLRRGQATIHVQYQKLATKRYPRSDSVRFGTCMGINTGDAGSMLALGLLAQADFPDRLKTKMLARFSQVLLKTAYGQAIDLNYERLAAATEDQVLQIHRFKTANYTIVGPLQYGAILAGAKENKLAAIEKYGLPIGMAFQLRDDELGLFSDEKTLGKPIGDDIQENKNTLLKIKAWEKANPEEKRFLKKTYGSRYLTKREIDRVRRITVETGALAYSQKMTQRLVAAGKKAIPRITRRSREAALLSQIADLMIKRKK